MNKDYLKWIIIALLGLALVIFIFCVGVFVGEAKARFSYGWADNYHRNFAGPKQGFFGNWQQVPRDDFISGHGVFGEIIEINESELVIKGRDDVEKIIILNSETAVKQKLEVGGLVVVIGSPTEEGKIEAEIIRLLPKDSPPGPPPPPLKKL
ncbi:MAG: hypothetical protein ABH822_00255 [Patescibacteria group bacterium]